MPNYSGLTYYNPFANAIAENLARQGDIQAEALTKGAAAKAGAVTSITNAGLSVLGDFVKYKQGEPRRKIEQAQLEKIQDEQRDDHLMKIAMINANGDPQIALSNLRAQGQIGLSAAGKLQAQITQDARLKLDDTKKSLEMFKQKLDLSAPILQGVLDSPEPQRATAYAEALPKVRELVGPALADNLPPEYNEDAVNRAMTWGMNASQIAERKRLAIELGRKALEDGKSAREKDEYVTKSLSLWLGDAHDQDTWDKGLEFARKADATPETLSKFGNTYSPEAAQAAARWGLSAAEREKQIPVQGTLEDYMISYARDFAHKPVDQLSAIDKERARARWTAAGYTSKADGGMSAAEREELADGIIKNPALWGNLTETKKSDVATTLVKKGFTQFDVNAVAKKAVAEKWRFTELRRLEGGVDAGGNTLTPEQIQQKKDEIQRSYLIQIGQDPDAKAAPVPPPVLPAKPAPTAPKAAAPGADDKLTITLPDGRSVKFKDAATRDAFLKKARLTLSAK